jgi:hypothetical protein
VASTTNTALTAVTQSRKRVFRDCNGGQNGSGVDKDTSYLARARAKASLSTIESWEKQAIFAIAGLYWEYNFSAALPLYWGKLGVMGCAGEILEGRNSTAKAHLTTTAKKKALAHARQVARSRSKNDLWNETRWTSD